MLRNILLIAALASPICVGEAQPDGAALLAPFKAQLQQALKRGLAKGPADAVAVCRLEAPAIAESLSRESVLMGRTSHRLRNPANAGPDWVDPIVNAYLENPSGRSPQTVALGEQRVGYVEPIVTKPLCLTCHGDNLAPDIANRLRELYPEDRATGFHTGDLRGVFWVEYPTAGNSASPQGLLP